MWFAPPDDMESLFKALADATRLRILGLLLTGEVCVCDIHQALKVPAAEGLAASHIPSQGGPRRHAPGLWIHYRLAQLSDPILAAIGDAVRHALTHFDSVHRDAERLQRKTGCCVPGPLTWVSHPVARIRQ